MTQPVRQRRPAGYSLRRGATFPKSFAISRSTFDALEDWIADNNASIDKATQGIDILTRLCILVVKAEVQKRSFGPLAPRQRSVPALAHKIPVQRITGRYFAGWQVRKTARGWMILNNEIEAYLIETGMYQRTRRPILKDSVLSMLEFIQTTRTADRFAEWIFAPRRSPTGQFRSFEQRVGRQFKMSLMAPDKTDRGASNPNISGPKGRLPA